MPQIKRKHIYVIITIVLLLVLFFPFKWVSHADGTREYSAVAVKYISWHYSHSVGDNVVDTSTLKIYFFPENQKDFETLRDEFFDSRM